MIPARGGLFIGVIPAVGVCVSVDIDSVCVWFVPVPGEACLPLTPDIDTDPPPSLLPPSSLPHSPPLTQHRSDDRLSKVRHKTTMIPNNEVVWRT